MAARKDQKRPKADWSLASRGAISSAAVGFLGLAAATTVGHMMELEPYWAGLAAGAGILGSIVRSMAANSSTPGVIFKLLRVLVAGGWSTFTLATEPTMKGMLALGVAAGVGAAVAPFYETGPAATTTPGRAVVLRKTTKLAEEWEQRILAVTNLRVTIDEVSQWATGSGYTLYGSLPVGATRKNLESHTDALAEAARLPNGCGVEVLGGDKRGLFVMNVATVNRLTQDVPWPGERAMGSINDPKPLGDHRDSTQVLVHLREASAVVVGQRGSGKTTTLHGLTWASGMNRDALVWHMDLNGGGLSQAWLRPWLDGTTDRPAVDWAAGDLEEGLAMSEVMLEILHDRKTTYAHLKLDADTGLMPVGDGLMAPVAIQLLVDEGAEVLSPQQRDPLKKQLRDNIEEIQRIGRDGAGNVLVSSLRATQDMLAPNIVKQATLRIGMLFQDPAEYAYLFGWGFPYTLDDLNGKGTGFIQTLETPIRPWKAGNLLPSAIREGAVFMANHRPNLDAAGVAIGGDLYEGRLERMRARFTPGADLVALPTAFLQRHGIELAAPAVPRVPAASTAPAAAPTAPPHLKVLQGGAADILARYNLEPDRGAQPLRAEQVHALEAAPGRVAVEDAAVPALLMELLQLYAKHRADRLHSKMLTAALGITQHKLAAMLQPLGIRPIPDVFFRGHRARGYARADIEQTVTMIRTGRLHVPAEVAEWQVS